MPTVDTVLSDYNKLSVIEQNEIKSRLINPNFSNGLDINKFIEEKRFTDGRVCPLCGGIHVARNGHRKDGTQRFICRDCNRSFVVSANSIVHGTRKSLDTWEKYIDCMLNGFSIRKSASICHIHQDTAFIWRHKILDALQNMVKDVKLEGIIEADETFFSVSYKGNHKNSKTRMPRDAHHRGTDIHVRGLSNEKVCVPCAIDRNGMSISRISNTARVKTDGLNRVFENHLDSNSTFIVDKASAYKKFAQHYGVELVPLKSKTDSRKGIYNLQRINNYHSQLKCFMAHFKGVSSKYLNNYLIWNNFINYSKEEYSEKKKILLCFVLSTTLVRHSKEISKKEPLPVLVL